MKKMIVAAMFLLPVAQTSAADCNNAQTQGEMNQCAAEDYKKSDKELNLVYQRALEKTSGELKNLLKLAQKKWISYRDADCKFQTQNTLDGSVYQMNMGICLRKKTEQRTKEFKDMLNCSEGDVSCSL